MDEKEPGWEGGRMFPGNAGILPHDYVNADSSIGSERLREFGLSPGKTYKALDVFTDSLTGDPELRVENDAGEIASFPAEFFSKAPAGKALTAEFMLNWWAYGTEAAPGGRYEIVRGLAGRTFTDERPDTKAYDAKPKNFNPNDYHSHPVASQFDDQSSEAHKANWKANMMNLPALNEERTHWLIYGHSKEATAKPSLDPELMRYVGITPGETYRVVGYVDRFKGGKGVTIVNDLGEEMTFRASLFRQ